MSARKAEHHDHLRHHPGHRSGPARTIRAICPQPGADLVGCFAPHEGSTSTAHGISSRPPLAGHEASRARPAAGPPGRETCEFAKRDGFIRRESRPFVKSASASQGDRA
ncbi:NIPSNAP family protein [Paracoccus salipaludis]|uniref:NIPSNAP family protein n=1 Tax=Paracoccus salipaludis TaxID=2032623 RepID=UPI0030842664